MQIMPTETMKKTSHLSWKANRETISLPWRKNGPLHRSITPKQPCSVRWRQRVNSWKTRNFVQPWRRTASVVHHPVPASSKPSSSATTSAASARTWWQPLQVSSSSTLSTRNSWRAVSWPVSGKRSSETSSTRPTTLPNSSMVWKSRSTRLSSMFYRITAAEEWPSWRRKISRKNQKRRKRRQRKQKPRRCQPRKRMKLLHKM